jgi:hypothetical protein
MQSVARARVGAKSRPGPLLDAMSKNVAGRQVKWRTSLSITHGELAEYLKHGEISGVSWRTTGEIIMGETWQGESRIKCTYSKGDLTLDRTFGQRRMRR